MLRRSANQTPRTVVIPIANSRANLFANAGGKIQVSKCLIVSGSVYKENNKDLTLGANLPILFSPRGGFVVYLLNIIPL